MDVDSPPVPLSPLLSSPASFNEDFDDNLDPHAAELANAQAAERLIREAAALAAARRDEELAAQAAASSGGQSQFPPERQSDDPREEEMGVPILGDLKLAQAFIDALKGATLHSDIEPLDSDILDVIENPPEEELKVDDDDLRFSIDLYLAIDNTSEATYTAARRAILRRFPSCRVLSFYEVKKQISSLTGITPVYRDMCPKSCVGFTGPLREALLCPVCSEQRYHPGTKTPRKRFITLLLAPQLQALWRTPEGACALQY